MGIIVVISSGVDFGVIRWVIDMLRNMLNILKGHMLWSLMLY